MKALTDTEVKRAAILKAVKSNVRLKYAILADEELNRILPELAARFDKAMAEGKFFELDVRSFLSDEVQS